MTTKAPGDTKTEKLFSSGVFIQSKELREFVERHDWQLYDLTDQPESRAFTWDEIGRKPPAEKYEMGHNYMFIPIPKAGQTLRDAYSVTKGLGPSLLVKDRKDKRWATLYIDRERYEKGEPFLFTRLIFDEMCALLMTPKTYFLPDPDGIGIKYDYLVDTFRKFFKIVRPEEYGLPVPVPMPQIH